MSDSVALSDMLGRLSGYDPVMQQIGGVATPTSLAAAIAAPPPIAAPIDPLQAAKDAIGTAYPYLAQHLPNVQAQYGEDKGDGRVLEYYAPWETENPNKGKMTLEVYDRSLSGDNLRDSLAADMLHYLGAVDPNTGKPVDPAYYALKQQVLSGRTPDNLRMDQEAYQGEVKAGQAGPSFDDWLSENRIDAYIRGKLFPAINPEWQRPEIYSDPMNKALDQMRDQLKTAPKK